MKLKKVSWYLKTLALKFEYGNVGKKSYIGKPIFIQSKRKLYVGNRVRIYPGLRAETPGVHSKIVFGNDISIGQNLHIVSYNTLVIQDGTTISGNVFISNVDHDYRQLNISKLKQKLIGKETKIGRNCFIGYGAVILPGTVIGDNCIIGANAVVKGKFSDNCVIAGVPAKVIKKYSPISKKWERIK